MSNSWTRHIISDRSASPSSERGPVPIELFVMSKCPDKVDCEQVFSKVLEQVQVPVSVDINYIARANASEPLQFECKHGPTECLGNIQELCFKETYPDISDFYSFDLCLNEEYASIGEGNGLARECAHRLGKHYEPVKTCASTPHGIELLARSVERTQSLGVEKSCTVYINNKLRCIHDETWKHCDGGHKVADFVRTIEEAYNT
ncbi:hypothetical protein BJV82DRAFT_520660 [Fennellomyces sp. T-0311]|nr:hypothetical protein BJV82DRAFT_520660 [Fennellomyces sp. T-0311]